MPGWKQGALSLLALDGIPVTALRCQRLGSPTICVLDNFPGEGAGVTLPADEPSMVASWVRRVELRGGRAIRDEVRDRER
jgi:hypothetical protein